MERPWIIGRNEIGMQYMHRLIADVMGYGGSRDLQALAPAGVEV
jgi:hypothetical protein